MIELDVVNSGYEWEPWWENFHNYYSEQGYNMNSNEEIARALSEWNAIDPDPESTKFYFENEHDCLLFMLRWV